MEGRSGDSAPSTFSEKEKKTHTHSFSAFNHFPDQSPSLMPAASGLGGSPEIHKGKIS